MAILGKASLKSKAWEHKYLISPSQEEAGRYTIRAVMASSFTSTQNHFLNTKEGHLGEFRTNVTLVYFLHAVGKAPAKHIEVSSFWFLFQLLAIYSKPQLLEAGYIVSFP